jgi:hypothetical protein
MRVYAVLLGVLLTAGSAYVAQLAVASAGFDRVAAASPGRGDLLGPGELWYGGVIDPITVEAMRAANPAIVLAAPRVRTVACARLAYPRRHAHACDRASMDSMM